MRAGRCASGDSPAPGGGARRDGPLGGVEDSEAMRAMGSTAGTRRGADDA